MSTPAFKVTDLCKSYKVGTAVFDKLNFEVASGKIFGLLGPNGCGKSTLLKMLTGILTADSGEIEVCGEPRSERTNALISYLPERTYVNSSMSVNELVDYFADFYEDFDKERAYLMLSDLYIDPTARMKTLSVLPWKATRWVF